MTIEFGDVLVVEFPFTDGTRSKRRPAVVISGADHPVLRGDVILVAITSQISSADGGLEEILSDWQVAGLAKPSALKPVVFTLDQRLIRAKIGGLAPVDVRKLRDLLARIIG